MPTSSAIKSLASLVLLITPLLIQAETTEPSAIQVEKLLETEKSWDGMAYQRYPGGKPQLTILKITVAPHTALSWHQHPLPNAAFVERGAITVEKKSTGEQRQFKAGEAVAEMVDGVHRGFTGREGATLVVFYAGQQGLPLAIPAE